MTESTKNEQAQTSNVAAGRLDEIVICGFIMAWVGKCQSHVQKQGDRCNKHDIKCSSCGATATKECDETGQFVCGSPLCDDCEHTINENGTNGGVGFDAKKPPEGMRMHCKKTEQKYLPWYMREEAKSI